MAFNKWLDSQPFVLRLLIAIILPVIFTVYMVIRDIHGNKSVLVVILDIIFGAPLGIVNWIVNIIFVATDRGIVDYAELFNL